MSDPIASLPSKPPTTPKPTTGVPDHEKPSLALPPLSGNISPDEYSELTSALIMPARVDAPTIRRVIEVVEHGGRPEPVLLAQENTPWILQQFFSGEIDLDVELAQRFQHMPVMATMNVRSMGKKSKRGVATLATQDNAAQVIVDVDALSKVAQFSFTFGSMLTLRFLLDDLSDVDRSRWLELMARKEGGMTFLWGPARWERDYLICVSRRYFTNVYAFSANRFEAAIRLTPEVTRQLLDWLASYWQAPPPKEEPPPLLTW